MVGVFVDSSAWYALSDIRDPQHLHAKAIWEGIKRSGPDLITSEWVFLETLALVSNRIGKQSSLVLGKEILDSGVVAVHSLDPGLRRLSWERYESSRSSVSLVDCGSFVLMEELCLTRAFAFDDDFERAGFVLEKAS